MSIFNMIGGGSGIDSDIEVLASGTVEVTESKVTTISFPSIKIPSGNSKSVFFMINMAELPVSSSSLPSYKGIGATFLPLTGKQSRWSSGYSYYLHIYAAAVQWMINDGSYGITYVTNGSPYDELIGVKINPQIYSGSGQIYWATGTYHYIAYCM